MRTNKIEQKLISMGLVPIRKKNKFQTTIFAVVKCPDCGKSRELWFGKIIYKKNYTGRCLKCDRKTRMGKNSPVWKGGEHYCQNGYFYIRIYEHDKLFPMAGKTGYAKRARYVYAKYVDRILDRTEHVHHKNRNRTDDRIENLELITMKEHLKQHYQERKIDRKGRFLPN